MHLNLRYSTANIARLATAFCEIKDGVRNYRVDIIVKYQF